ncbi:MULTISPECIES: ABC transporter permease subunit [Bradyrhizobium]|uniref:ABC transporter permease subunit n=1 Tax=Bradyrhizobium zhengyangense TaxID=2911009 RepID=A0A9X1RFU7_9BRAD|nr:MULTISPECIES: ABC transporter permease subunit [Bradyrhizobium]MCG2629395.1 ABC transporter permease subunit [Bradyrhizobium zhengyangense]MCG2644676.1 ABC transporter permease subunit [Bradyrhizobium zhengyangense]MCG2670909.1 ABC transporter permease subunit [Bradyrhizobium zhengyangense]MDN4984542.1 ABC transporter permease subunit [Bradyrhizobium sp. WYCCWR 13022]MDN5002534.1 ABC transporter permease subunit [Bradyrhizobium sp. WYCCWR 12677]
MTDRTTIPGSWPRSDRRLPLSELLARWPFLQIAPLLTFLSVVFVLPVGGILVLSLFDAHGALTLENFSRVFKTNLYVSVLVRTIQTAAWATGICLTLGYPVAYALSKANAGVRAAILTSVLVPLWTSFLIRNLSLIIIFGRRGLINVTGLKLSWLDHSIAFLYNWNGVMIGLSSSLLPLAIITMYSVMEGIEPNLEKAASTLGARPSHGFWRVYFPLSLPGVAAGGILIFVSALGFFITPQLLGSPRETMIAQLIIEQVTEVLHWNFAAAISAMLLLATLISFFLFDRVVGMHILTGEEGDQHPSRLNRMLRRGGMKLINGISWITASFGLVAEKLTGRTVKLRQRVSRPILSMVSLAIALFLILPIFCIVPISFSNSLLFGWPPQGFSLRWYTSVLSSPIWVLAFWRSVGIAAITSLMAIAIAIPAALFLVRQKTRAKFLIILLLTIPIFLPHIITAVALFYAYARFGLIGTWVGLIMGHMVFALPYATMSLMAVLKNYNRSLDYAAWTMGASKFKTFRYIMLPIIKPGVYGAFLFAFIQSFDEVTISLFVTGGSFTTLPKQLYQQAVYGASPELAAVSTLLLALILGFMLIANSVGGTSRRV